MIEKIKDIIANQLQIDINSIHDGDDIFDDLRADSLDVVEMLMAVEITYGVSVPDDEIMNMRTINDMKHYIELHSDSEYEYIDEDQDEEDEDLI